MLRTSVTCWALCAQGLERRVPSRQRTRSGGVQNGSVTSVEWPAVIRPEPIPAGWRPRLPRCESARSASPARLNPRRAALAEPAVFPDEHRRRPRAEAAQRLDRGAQRGHVARAGGGSAASYGLPFCCHHSAAWRQSPLSSMRWGSGRSSAPARHRQQRRSGPTKGSQPAAAASAGRVASVSTSASRPSSHAICAAAAEVAAARCRAAGSFASRGASSSRVSWPGSPCRARILASTSARPVR